MSASAESVTGKPKASTVAGIVAPTPVKKIDIDWEKVGSTTPIQEARPLSPERVTFSPMQTVEEGFVIVAPKAPPQPLPPAPQPLPLSPRPLPPAPQSSAAGLVRNVQLVNQQPPSTLNVVSTGPAQGTSAQGAGPLPSAPKNVDIHIAPHSSAPPSPTYLVWYPTFFGVNGYAPPATYYHGMPVPPPAKPPQPTMAQTTQKVGLCAYHLQGRCFYGQKCKWKHQ